MSNLASHLINRNQHKGYALERPRSAAKSIMRPATLLAMALVLAIVATMVIYQTTTVSAAAGDATGKPVITGTLEVGRTLTADISGISDPDGMTNPGFLYDWETSDDQITWTIGAGTAGQTFSVEKEHIGKYLRVRAGFSDDANNSEAIFSDPTTQAVTRHTIWTANAVVKQDSSQTSIGYDGGTNYPSSTLSDVDFAYDATTYTIGTIELENSGSLDLTVTPDPSDDDLESIVLVINGTSLPMAHATESSGTFSWTDANLSWNDGDTVSLRAEIDYPTIWIATATVKNITNGQSVGYGEDYPGSTITDGDFPHNSTAYRLRNISRSGSLLTMEFNTNVQQNHLNQLVLVIDGNKFPIKKAVASGFNLFFTGISISWSDGDTVAMRLEIDNAKATGTPTVTGTPQVGDVLTADTSGIADADGLPDDAQGYQYQWQSSDGTTTTNIAGATAPHYYPTNADVGKSIKVQVIFKDGNGVSEGPLTSAPSAAIAGSGSVNVLWSTTMTVGKQTGQMLSVLGYSGDTNFGSIADDEFSHGGTDYTVEDASYFSLGLTFGVSPELGAAQLANWRFGVAGAGFDLDEGTHATQSGASGVRWTDHNQSWNEGDRIALAVLLVNSPATGTPAISGTPQVGEALTAVTSGISDENGLPDDAQGFDYQWQRSDDGNAWTDIAGATAPDYYTTDADAGKHIRVQVSFEDGDDFDEGPINSVGGIMRGNVLDATLTAAVGGPSVGYQTIGSQGALTPNTFSYREVNHRVVGLITNGGNLIIRFNANPDTSAEDELTLVIGSSRFLLSDATHSTQNQTYTWTNTGITWSAGQTVSIAIEGDIYDATADVIVQPSTTVSVPWSATMTVGEETGGTLDGFLGSALNFVTTPFGSLSDSTIDIVDGTSHSVEGVTYDSSGTGTLTLYTDPAFTGSVSLAYGADDTLATTDATAGTEGTIDKYDWSPHDDPGWSDGHRVALAIVTKKNVDATGTPVISGTPRVGEALTAETSGISDANGVPDAAQGFDYQWQSSPDGNTWTDITDAFAPNYYPSDSAVGQRIRVQVSFKDDDGFNEGPLTSKATPAVTDSETHTVPWSTTMTVGTYAQGLAVSYGYNDGVAGNTFGSLTDTSLTFQDQTYTVHAVTNLLSGSINDVALSIDQALPVSFTLLHGQDGNLSSRSTDSALLVSGVFNYGWRTTNPGWNDKDEVAVAIMVPRDFPPTGAPSISGTVAEGETLNVDTSAIGDPNGLTSPTFTYQWERVDCATSSDNGVITGQAAQTYTVIAADTDCSIKASVTFKDDDGYEHSLSQTVSADPGVRISPSSLIIDEGSTAEYTIRLQAEPTADVTITLNTVGIAGSGLTVATTSLTFTTTNWNTTQSVTISSAHDDDIDDVESLQIRHVASSSDGDYHGITVDPVQVAITDDDQIVELTQSANEVTEGATINFGFQRTGNIAQEVDVHINITQQGSFIRDDSIGPQVATIPAGTRFVGFGITTNNDRDEEPDGSITLEITSDAAYFIGDRSSATVAVLDNEQLPEPPTGLATSLEQDSVIISWTPGHPGLLNGHPASITSYQWRRSIAGTSDWNPDWTTIPGGNTTSVIDNAAPLGPSTYRYEIRAVTEVGQTDAASIDYQLPPLVTNLDQGTAATTVTPRAAQSFVTGSEQGGYALHSVSIHTSVPGTPSAVSVSIHSDSSGNPGSEVHALTNPDAFADGTNIFTTPENTVLSANTTYHVVTRYSGSDSFAVHQTASTSETGQTGWSIADQHHAGTPWASQADPLRIQVNGVTVPPVPKTPHHLRALAGDAAIRLVWDTPPRSIAVINHQYRRSTGGGATWSTDWTDIPNSGTGQANEGAYTYTDVSNDTTYTYQVRSVNATDHSHPSNSATATPRAGGEELSMTLAAGGCNEYASPKCSDSSEGNTFLYGGLTYAVTLVSHYDGGVYLRIERVFTPGSAVENHLHFEEMKQRLELHIGTVVLRLRDRDILQQNTANYSAVVGAYLASTIHVYWDDVDLSSLPAGTVKLVLGSLADDTTAPTLSSAWGHARKIHLDFSEVLDPASVPDPSAFTATVAGTERDVTEVATLANKDAVSGARRESELILTMESPAADGETVTVSYVPPDTDPLRDLAGNKVAAFNNAMVGELGRPVAYLPIGALSVADTVGYENPDGSTMDFVVTLFPAQNHAVTVDYTTADGTAVTPADYTATQGTLTFAAGDTTKTVPVPIIDDDGEDAGETFTLILSNATGATIVDEAGVGEISNTEPDSQTGQDGLSASFHDGPSSHDGQNAFTVELRFSEEIPVSYVTLRDHAFEVTGGDVTRARRLDKPSNIRWEISVEPASDEAVTLTLPATTDCAAQGAICTEDGGKPAAGASLTVPGPAAQQQQQQNSEATGAPTISGTARVGETLTASTSGITDADGLNNVSFNYQWITGESDMAGATSSTYQIDDADVGKTIKVRVTFTDDADNEESVTSAATATVEPKPNSPAAGAPTISGTLQAGETLTAATAGITDADGLDNVSYSYQWMRGDGNAHTDIAGETGQTYDLSDADVGRTIRVRVSFNDDAENAERLTSPATGAVAARPQLTATFENPPTSHDGRTDFTFELRFSHEVQLGYQAVRDHVLTVAGASTTQARRMAQPSNARWEITLTPSGAADVTIALPATTDCTRQGAVCATDGRKLSKGLHLAVPGPENRPAAGQPTIDGATRVDETLTASTDGISDPDGMNSASFTYRWLRSTGGSHTEIAGANASSYTLTDADQGKTIKVRVSFRDYTHNQESLTSAATEQIAPRPEPLTARFPVSVYQSTLHHGTDDRPQIIVAFSHTVTTFEKTTPSVRVAGATVTSIAEHLIEDELENAWIFWLDPEGDQDIEFTLLPSQQCDAGGICTEERQTLSQEVTTTLPGPA